MYPCIPSEDIVWQNVGRLMLDQTFSKVKGFLQPVLASSIAIMGILSIEAVSLHYTPKLSTVILYITTTLLVLFSFYVTPYLTFQSVQM